MSDNIPETTASSEVSTGFYQPEPEQEIIEQREEINHEQPMRRYMEKENEQRNSEQRNFAALRLKAEQAERERDNYAKRIAELEQQTDDFSLGSDDIAEGKHLKKMQQNLTREISNLKEELQGYKKQTQQAITESRIKSSYPDFDSIVNTANLDALQRKHPEIMATLQNSPDLYSQAVSAYTMIKNLGITGEKNYSADHERAQANAYKPRATNAVSPQRGDSPLTKANAFANGLTKELQEQLRKEMDEAMQNY